jgi:hypothetical protein
LENGTIKFQGSSESFFENSNLLTFFGDGVKRIENNIVVNL